MLSQSGQGVDILRKCSDLGGLVDEAPDFQLGQQVVGWPHGANLLPPPQLPIQPLQPRCGLVPLLNRVQVAQSLVQRLPTPVGPLASRRRNNSLYVVRPFPSTLGGQQLLRFLSPFPADVAAVLLQEVKVTQLMRHLSALYHLQSQGNSPVAVADQVLRVRRPNLPSLVYGLFPRPKVAQHHTQLIPILQFHRP